MSGQNLRQTLLQAHQALSVKLDTVGLSGKPTRDLMYHHFGVRLGAD